MSVQVLLQSSKKVAFATSLKDLKVGGELFCLDSFLIQKADVEFVEFVDVDDYESLSSGDKLQIVEFKESRKESINSKESLNL